MGIWSCCCVLVVCTHADFCVVAESPLQFYVNQANSPSVTAYGPGLSYGVADTMATFTVFTEDASEGGLAKQEASSELAEK